MGVLWGGFDPDSSEIESSETWEEFADGVSKRVEKRRVEDEARDRWTKWAFSVVGEELYKRASESGELEGVYGNKDPKVLRTYVAKYVKNEVERKRLQRFFSVQDSSMVHVILSIPFRSTTKYYAGYFDLATNVRKENYLDCVRCDLHRATMGFVDVMIWISLGHSERVISRWNEGIDKVERILCSRGVRSWDSLMNWEKIDHPYSNFRLSSYCAAKYVWDDIQRRKESLLRDIRRNSV